MEKGQIRLLADALVDQIAAGEVVERPASVVKEFVENSLDAGARRVQVEVRDGGSAWIAVSDDGRGMTPADARLSLQRHATSKLSSADDLNHIASYGFRGEALPAIASVSRFRMVTRPEELAEAWEIRTDCGVLVGERALGAPVGTRIEVADLFASVPARRKFLKRASTEWGHVADWLTRLALSLPDVHLELRRDERRPLVWPACSDRLDRVASVLSEDEAAALVSAEAESEAGQLHALVSVPDRTRPNTKGIYLFVNGRPIRDVPLRQALLFVYRDLLPRGRFPSALLFLTVPPESVDVNVHPAKWEVRFAEPQAIQQLVRRTVRRAIEGRSWLGADVSPAQDAATTPGPTPYGAGRDFAPGRHESRVADRREETNDWIFARRDPVAPLDGDGPSADGSPRDVAVEGARGMGEGARQHFGELRLLGQLLASYLLVESSDGLLLVDQHAAHERVLYERLRAQWLERGVERQGLLIPAPLELGAAGVAALASAWQLMLRLGFEVEPFGETAVVIRSLPALLAGRDPATLVGELAQELADRDDPADAAFEAEDTRLLESADRTFASLACHSARRAGDHLEAAEQRHLLEELDTIPWAPTCPHGRPVAISLGRAEIEQRFRRR